MDLQIVPEVLRELGSSPAWRLFFSYVESLVESAKEEALSAKSYEEFREIKGVVSALRAVLGWRDQLLADLDEVRQTGRIGD